MGEPSLNPRPFQPLQSFLKQNLKDQSVLLDKIKNIKIPKASTNKKNDAPIKVDSKTASPRLISGRLGAIPNSQPSLKDYIDFSLSFIDEELAEILVRGGGIGMFIPELSNSSLDTIINYSGETIHYNIPEQENYFYDNSSIKYQDTELTAEYIEVNWNTNKLISYIENNIKPSVKTDSKSHAKVSRSFYKTLVMFSEMVNFLIKKVLFLFLLEQWQI